MSTKLEDEGRGIPEPEPVFGSRGRMADMLARRRLFDTQIVMVAFAIAGLTTAFIWGIGMT